MKIKIFNKGFNYSQDGQGNRLVIHMQGCNLRCPWCTNPEGLEVDGVVMQRGTSALTDLGAGSRKHEDRPGRLSCEEWELDDLLNLCRESSSLFFDGGGVTFTGGEPFMQANVLEEALKSLKEMKIHTAIETNGTSAVLPRFFPFIDQLIMDFKTANPVKHETFLGSGGKVLVENIRVALENHRYLLIRIPLVQGFNTSSRDLEEFLLSLGEGPRPHANFEFLTYHEFGREKWRQCGFEYSQQEAYVSEETLRLFTETFRSRYLRVIQT